MSQFKNDQFNNWRESTVSDLKNEVQRLRGALEEARRLRAFPYKHDCSSRKCMVVFPLRPVHGKAYLVKHKELPMTGVGWCRFNEYGLLLDAIDTHGNRVTDTAHTFEIIQPIDIQIVDFKC